MWPFNKFGNRSKKSSAVVGVSEVVSGSGVVWTPNNYENFARETYLKNVVAFKAIDEIAKSVASVPWNEYRRVGDEKKELVTDSPVAKVLKRPNPNQGLPFVMLRATAFLVMSGDSFFEKVTPDTGPNKDDIKELYALRPDRFKLAINKTTGLLEKYTYSVNKGRKVDFKINPITGQCDVLHCKSFHPLDDYFGASVTEPAAREIDTSNSATEWNKSVLDNEGKPGMIFKIVGNVSMEQLDELERKLAEDHGGPSNAGKDLIITGERGTDAKPYSWSPKDLDFNEGDLRLSRKIAMGYGVPPMLLGIPGEATFANYKEARLAFWESTIMFYLNYYREELNNWLYEPDGDKSIDYNLDEVPALASKREMIWNRAQDSDFLTINEKREMTGSKSVEGGDVILIAAGMIPLGEEPPPPAEPPPEDDEPVDEEDEEEVRLELLRQGYTDEEINQMLGLEYVDEEKETFKCECIDCGYKLTSKKHCVDLVCPKCGGKMRRQGRPGDGRDIEE